MRIMLAVAAMAASTAPLMAETLPSGPDGALAGRSPVTIARVAAAPDTCNTMHSVPAGKLPHYGTHAIAGACDRAVTIAANDATTRTRAD